MHALRCIWRTKPSLERYTYTRLIDLMIRTVSLYQISGQERKSTWVVVDNENEVRHVARAHGTIPLLPEKRHHQRTYCSHPPEPLLLWYLQVMFNKKARLSLEEQIIASCSAVAQGKRR